MRKNIVIGVVSVLGLVLLSVFTVYMAAPNVVTAGQKATERAAVSTLRTFVWAQDEMIELHGRAGLIEELAGTRKVGDAFLPAPLLRPPFKALRPGSYGDIATFSGYQYAVYVFDGAGVVTDGDRPPQNGARSWIAYAWPSQLGTSAEATFCINGHDETLQTDNAKQRYGGLKGQPAADACPRRADGHLRPGVGGDGAQWDWWRGKPSRRARKAGAK